MPGSSESVQKFTKVEGRSRGFSARDLSLVASFAALIWVLGVPGAIDPVGSGVPITLQTLGVMLAGAVLGARRGAAASLVVIALCAIGLPVLAGGRGGGVVCVAGSAVAGVAVGGVFGGGCWCDSCGGCSSDGVACAFVCGAGVVG